MTPHAPAAEVEDDGAGNDRHDLAGAWAGRPPRPSASRPALTPSQAASRGAAPPRTTASAGRRCGGVEQVGLTGAGAAAAHVDPADGADRGTTTVVPVSQPGSSRVAWPTRTPGTSVMASSGPAGRGPCAQHARRLVDCRAWRARHHRHPRPRRSQRPPWHHREIAGYDLDRCDIALDQPELHTDLPRMRGRACGPAVVGLGALRAAGRGRGDRDPRAGRLRRGHVRATTRWSSPARPPTSSGCGSRGVTPRCSGWRAGTASTGRWSTSRPSPRGACGT